jgi:secreted PhoX family phosphatase
MSAAALALGARGASAVESGYGPLQDDPRGVVELPRGFRYRIISGEGSRLSNNDPVPSDHDGMAAFRGRRRGTTVLVRNHELNATDNTSDNEPVRGNNPYDPAPDAPGGTTAIVVDNDTRREIRDFVTSSGQSNNCAGGATPWGTWLTCEETFEDVHGYVFEVDPNNPQSDLSKTPITGMGKFSHEAADIDPDTGIAYLTEDDPSGSANTEVEDPSQEPVASASFLYRYIPNNKAKRPGALQEGGQLQVMTIEEGLPGPGPNADIFQRGQRFGVGWADIINPDAAHQEALTKDGVVRFNRLEGAFFRDGVFWFDDTNGGEQRLGQIFRYFPRTNTLELFYEGNDSSKIESPDNITLTPWGDLWFAEDEAVPEGSGDGRNRIMGVTPGGQVYRFARNVKSDSEFAGPTFSPDGRTFFVNIQNPGLTLAIWGPFRYRNARRRRQMAVAAPPEELAPRVSGELAEAAERYGMTTLEAPAFDRLDVPLI